jgi:two-component system OmpR family sensor kinase
VLVLVLLTVTAAMVVAGLASAAALRGYLLDRVDSQLEQSIGSIADRPPDDDGPGGRRVPAPPFVYYIARYAADGERIWAYVSTDEPDLSNLDSAAAGLAGEAFTVPSVSGSQSWRVHIEDVRTGGSVVVGVPLDDVESTVARLLRIDALVAVALLLLAAAASWWAARSSLRPLVAVEETAHAIAAGDLSRRVPAGHPHTEVGSLAASFNTMVDRFETAYEAQRRSEVEARASEDRMRRFVGDASHELRTPLTAVRGFAELIRSGAVEDAELRPVVHRIEDEATRMGLLVEDLLLLARLDQQRPLHADQVDLLPILADAANDARLLAPGHHVSLTAPEASDPVIVIGDEARLRQVVTNLVTNAVQHNPPGTHVAIRLAIEQHQAVIVVQDDGRMNPDVAARAFERFYRGDASRTRSSGGTGLGLAIVAALVTAHGGTVHLDADDAGSTFTVRLPLAP